MGRSRSVLGASDIPPAVELSKGANATVTTSSVRATVLWAGAAGAPDVDTSALLLGSDGAVRSDDDFVFYDQPVHASGAVRHVSGSAAGLSVGEVLEVDLGSLVAGVERVVLAVSTHDGVLGQVRGLSSTLADDQGHDLLRFTVDDATEERALVLGELYRRGGR